MNSPRPIVRIVVRPVCVDRCLYDDANIWEGCPSRDYLCICLSLPRASSFLNNHTVCIQRCPISEQDEFISIVHTLSGNCAHYDPPINILSMVTFDNPMRGRMLEIVGSKAPTPPYGTPSLKVPSPAPSSITMTEPVSYPTLLPSPSTIPTATNNTPLPTSLPTNSPTPKQSTSFLPLLAAIPATAIFIFFLTLLIRFYRKRQRRRDDILPSTSRTTHDNHSSEGNVSLYTEDVSGLVSVISDYPANEAQKCAMTISPPSRPPTSGLTAGDAGTPHGGIKWLNSGWFGFRKKIGKEGRGENGKGTNKMEGVLGFPYDEGDASRGGQEMRDVDAWDAYLRVLAREEKGKGRAF